MGSKAYCIIYGEKFSPKRVEDKIGLRFNNKNEPGDIAKTGRYKNHSIPYGSAELEGDTNDIYTIQSHEILDLLLEYIDIIKSEGATDIIFHLDYVYEKQCNMEVDVDIIEKLGKLKIPLSISCYENE